MNDHAHDLPGADAAQRLPRQASGAQAESVEQQAESADQPAVAGDQRAVAGATAPVVIHDSTPFWVFVLAISVVLTLGMFAVGGAGFVVAVLSAGHALRAAARLIRPRPRITITDEGLIDESYWFSGGLLPWHEVLDVRETRWGGIDIDLRDESVYWERLSPVQALGRMKTQLYGFGPALIMPLPLRGSRAEIVEALQEGLDRYTLSSGAASPPLLDSSGGPPDGGAGSAQ